MSRFGSVLRRVERRLEAPEPERSRILMEMAGDLEELYRTYRERGLDEVEARHKAEAWLAPSPSALEALRSVHLPAFDRLLDRLGGTTRGHIELGLVTVLCLMAVGAGLAGTLRLGAVPASSPGLWIVAGLLAVGLAVGARQGYTLFVRGDRLGPGWRGKLDRVLAAAVGSALAGLLAGGLRLTLTDVPAGVERASHAFWTQLLTASSLAALALVASLFLCLLWLLLRVRADVVSRARAELRETVGTLEDEKPDLLRETRR